MQRLAMVGVLVGVVGCVPVNNAAFTEALAPAANVGTSVTCDSGCKLEWQRAQLWVANHAAMKIQTATDVLIQTYGVSDMTPSYSMTVTKTPLSADQYRVEIQLACGNMFGCNPRADDVRAAFLYYVKTGQDLIAGKTSPGQGLR